MCSRVGLLDPDIVIELGPGDADHGAVLLLHLYARIVRHGFDEARHQPFREGVAVDLHAVEITLGKRGDVAVAREILLRPRHRCRQRQ